MSWLPRSWASASLKSSMAFSWLWSRGQGHYHLVVAMCLPLSLYLSFCKFSSVSPISLQCFQTPQREQRCSQPGVHPPAALLRNRSLVCLEGLQLGPWGTDLPGAILSQRLASPQAAKMKC